MAFCSNCGKQLNSGAKFCAECGTPVSNAESKRKTVFEGDIHKCPHCGETLKAFETICPTCGAELRGTSSSSAISTLAEKLENATSDKHRIVIIKNFPIPNTREDILEFMLLASSNFDSSYYATHLHEEDISDAWLTKIEQCYSKAKLSFGTHPDFERIENIYLEIKADCAEKERKVKYEEKARRDAQERAETEKDFKKSKLRIAIIIFAVISALCVAVSFNDDEILSGIIAIVMFTLFVTAFLMGSGVIKEKVKNVRLLPLILAFVLFIPYFATYNSSFDLDDLFDKKTYETLIWNELAMGNMLPTPDSLKGRIIVNSDEELRIYLADATKSTFSEYNQTCKEKGFTLDSTKNTTSYEAYNADGYRLCLYFNESDSELSVNLYDPVKRNTLNWSTVPLMKNIPTPPSNVGEFLSNYDWTVSVSVLDVTYEEYEAYVEECIEAGFTIDFLRYENSFYGDDKNGNKLNMSWEGNNTIHISVTNYEFM
ncbi:MAG: DUF6591 domain-containing protein [Lachnospiraceae bacterium]